jgi:hypothetical protein
MKYVFDPPARQGDTFVRVLRWLEDDATTPINLSGASVEWGIAPIPDGLPSEQFVDEDEAQITNASLGEITLTLSDVQTRELKARAYAFEVTVAFPDGTRTTILDGFLPVAQEVVS